MIDDFSYSILKAIDTNSNRSPTSLINEFDDKVCTALDKLEKQGYILLEFGQGYTGGMIHYSLTPAGKDFLTFYCHACECIPCDCGFGN